MHFFQDKMEPHTLLWLNDSYNSWLNCTRQETLMDHHLLTIIKRTWLFFFCETKKKLLRLFSCVHWFHCLDTHTHTSFLCSTEEMMIWIDMRVSKFFESTIPWISPVFSYNDRKYNKRYLIKSVNGSFLSRVTKASLESSNALWNPITALIMSSSKYTLGTHCILFSSFSPFQHTPGSLHWFHGWTHKIRMPANRCVLKTWQGTAN